MDPQPIEEENLNQKIGYTLKCLLIWMVILPGCAAFLTKSYDQTVSQWKSYRDLERWMERDFSFDMERFKKFEGTLPPPRTPEETFRLKSGIYIDAAIFARETLSRIDSSYKARIVVLLIKQGANLYVCSFVKDSKLFMMDYGTPYKKMVGVHGPFNSLEQYKAFFEKHHPVIKHVQAVTYLP